ncbi:MAG: hypothetical protein IKY23_01685 [Lachnospiraceae bacterium]|nr:hypothetical protein [Lachnospiraceae bacterium]
MRKTACLFALLLCAGSLSGCVESPKQTTPSAQKEAQDTTQEAAQDAVQGTTQEAAQDAAQEEAVDTPEDAVDVSYYLNEKALHADPENQLASYQIETAFKGTFRITQSAKAQFYVQDSVAAYARYDYGTMIFDELVSSTGKYVEAGEVIAKVHIDVKESDLTQVRLALTRMEERLSDDRSRYEKEERELEIEAYEIEDFHDRGVALRQREEIKENHKQDIENRTKEIEKTKEQLAKMETAAALKEITAPISGYIRDVGVLVKGRAIPNETMVAVLEPQKSAIVWVNNPDNAFRYGKEVTVTCANTTNEESFTGVVITPSLMSVAEQATDRRACIRLDDECVKYLETAMVDTITAKVNTVEQEDAVMIKAEALEIEEEEFYATVVLENGSFLKKKVLVGGMNGETFWVMEGLKENDRVVVP